MLALGKLSAYRRRGRACMAPHRGGGSSSSNNLHREIPTIFNVHISKPPAKRDAKPLVLRPAPGAKVFPDDPVSPILTAFALEKREVWLSRSISQSQQAAQVAASREGRGDELCAEFSWSSKPEYYAPPNAETPQGASKPPSRTDLVLPLTPQLTNTGLLSVFKRRKTQPAWDHFLMARLCMTCFLSITDFATDVMTAMYYEENGSYAFRNACICTLALAVISHVIVTIVFRDPQKSTSSLLFDLLSVVTFTQPVVATYRTLKFRMLGLMLALGKLSAYRRRGRA